MRAASGKLFKTFLTGSLETFLKPSLRNFLPCFGGSLLYQGALDRTGFRAEQLQCTAGEGCAQRFILGGIYILDNSVSLICCWQIGYLVLNEVQAILNPATVFHAGSHTDSSRRAASKQTNT